MKMEEIIAAVIVKANLIENQTDCLLDIRASKHLCANKELFHHFEEVKNGECVYMGNSSIAGVLGKGKIFLKLTFGKNCGFYVHSLCRNLVSKSLLNKVELKISFKA